jgi:DNA-binding transcriptional ArsR family regulator
MSNTIADKRIQHLHAILLSAVWRQWGELGGSVTSTSRQQTRCVIDPEALILITLWLAEDDLRLIDVAMSWAVLNSDLVSVQRIKNLQSSYPPGVSEKLSGFAQVIAEKGADARWKPLYTRATEHLAYRDKKARAVRINLSRPPALWLRLRGLLGLGIRPDIVAFLMRRPDPRSYIEAGRIADAVGYSRPAVKRVLDALTAAGGLTVAPGRDPGYAIGWSSLFMILGPEPEQLPAWRYCHQTFALLAEYLTMIRARGTMATSAFIQRTDARKMTQRHGGYLIENRMFSPHEFPQINEVEPFLRKIEMMVEDEF